MEVKMGGKSMLQKVSSLLPDKEADHECGNLYPLMKKKIWPFIENILYGLMTMII